MRAISNILLRPSEEHYIDQQVDQLSRYFSADDDLPIMDIVITGSSDQPRINAAIFLDDASFVSHQSQQTTGEALKAAFQDLNGQISRWQTDKLNHQALRQNIQSRRGITY